MLAWCLGRLTDPRGEFTLVVGGFCETSDSPVEQVSDSKMFEEFGRLTENGLSRRQAITELARAHRLRSRDVFAAIDRARRS